MIIRKFEEQVNRSAEKPAVITEKKHLTYKELNSCANGVALAIRDHETFSAQTETTYPGQVVGLLFEHSADMIIGVLGTLKADKIYVPLDINYPANRLVYMLENSGAHLLLTNSGNFPLAERLAKEVEHEVRIINIDTLDNSVEYPNIEREPSGDKLAYILYTSGSTGRPKGVLQNHENVCYYIRNWTERFSITPADRMTLFSAFSHDGAGQDMFGALHNGAILYPYNILNRANIAELAQWLIDEKITIWHSVPTLYRYFVDTLAQRDRSGRQFPGLRLILLGGEQIREHDIEIFKRYFPNSRFANVYGQTESSVSSIWMLGPEDTFTKTLIGEPLDETKLLIVNDKGTIVEGMGVGEIVVASRYLALGYWRDEENTKKVFLHDPDMGSLYRTGDLGRLVMGGNIEIMGRKDNQVKIRGFRIEVGEIETALLNHPAIKETVVETRSDNQGNAHLYAYYVLQPTAAASGPDALTVPTIRKHLANYLPEYMIPSYFVQLEHMPLTPNGKIDRKKLPEPEHTRTQLGVTYIAPENILEEKIAGVWKEVLQLDMVGMEDNFFDLGGTSFDILKITSKFYEVFKKEIPVVSIFRYPTLRSFAAYIRQEEGGKPLAPRLKKRKPRPRPATQPIAVIGMAGRYPGADNIHEFWDNIINGKETVTFFSDAELRQKGVEENMLRHPDYVNAFGVLSGVDSFDASFFNYSPAEAELMDPQLRLLHECSWEALENAGYHPDMVDGLIGLYAGNSPNQFWVGLAYLNRGNSLEAGFLNNNYSTKVSYKLNLKGPSVIVQTACSTSLVAIHFAVRGLCDGECDMALAGGVSVTLPDQQGYLFQEGMLLSRDGHNRTFDANAGGTVFGNGVGMVVLKRLDDALEDGDSIDAVIKGTAINNDGNRKVGLTAPSVEGQAEVIAAALENAGVDPEQVTYIETHGTATILGDPVEIEALKLAFALDKKGCCAIGSVKTNVGHLNSASGVAGFIKTVQALKHKILPPSLHYETANPAIDFENSPFYVNTRLSEWRNPYEPEPRRAGISSFGIGGTNAHVVLEEAPPHSEHFLGVQGNAAWGANESSSENPLQLILLSARTRTALERMTSNFLKHVRENPGINLAEAAFTLQLGRKAFKYRRKAVCTNVDELDQLPSVPITMVKEGRQPVIFLFSGLGAQYVNMGRELYQGIRLIREEMERCFKILEPLLGYNIKEILYPTAGSESTLLPDSIPHDINRIENAQPVVFILEYALTRFLLELGIQPAAMMGYSFGEYVAACISGVIGLEDALRLVAARGRLLGRLPEGAMLSVPAPAAEIEPLLNAELSLAVDNGPSCIVSGPTLAIDDFEDRMKEKRYLCMRINTSHALHSKMMAPVQAEFMEVMREISCSEPKIPYISNVTGTWQSVEASLDPGYWITHLRQTVQYARGLEELSKMNDAIFIEIGPGRDIATLVKRTLGDDRGGQVLDMIPVQGKGDTAHSFLLERIGRLWQQGVNIDWSVLHLGESRHRLHLPIYPFERQRYWLEGDPTKVGQREPVNKAPLGKMPDITDWFYVPTWQQSELPWQEPHYLWGKLNWLVFANEDNFSARLVAGLKEKGQNLVVVRQGKGYAHLGAGEYTIDPAGQEDYDALLHECRITGREPRRILHCWNVTSLPAVAGNPAEPWETTEQILDLGYYSLLHLARAIGREEIKENMDITVISDGMQGVRGDDLVNPIKATLLAPIQVIPREYPNIRCRSIDIEARQPETGENAETIDRLLTEIYAMEADSVVALRGQQRWLKTFESRRLYRSGSGTPRLKEGGVYLITGGLGGIGLELSNYLAKAVKAKLILTGQTPLPPREQWPQWQDQAGMGLENERNREIARKLKKVLELEQMGAQVLVFGVDAADKEQMQEVIAQARRQFGKIDGVIHAAGKPDGTIIQRRTREMSRQILEPKVQGTLILEELLKENPLDFFILFSSTVAITALGGQVGYCAANCFLDHYARYRSARENTYTVSINWDAWQQIGMAAKAVQKAAPGTDEETVDHPLFVSYEKYSPKQAVLKSFLKAPEDWVMDEHRILGEATLPGTAYLEMARAALEKHTQTQSIRLKDVYFLNPLTIEDGKQKEVRTIIEKHSEGYSFMIIGQLQPGQDHWQEHARGNAGLVKNPGTHHVDIAGLMESCPHEERIAPSTGSTGQPFQRGAMGFGPRWDNIRRESFGKDQGIGVLELPDTFKADTRSYRLHPALVDIATTFLRPRVQKEGSYLPFYYKELVINGDIPAKVVCHARTLEMGNEKSVKHTLKFDVTILDPQGNVLVEINEFTLKRVEVDVDKAQQILEGNEVAAAKTGKTAHPLSYFLTDGSENTSTPGQAQKESRLNPLKDAILPGEGLDAFLRIMGADALHQVVVSTTDLPGRLNHLRHLTEEFHRQQIQQELPSRPKHARPELSTAYESPVTQTEQLLAEVWQELLGIEKVGIIDDFFELGGDSLKAVNFAGRIHQKTGTEVPLAEFFDRPTIRQLAQYIDGKSQKKAYSSIQPVETKEYYILSPAQKRLFILQEMEPGHTGYNLTSAVLLEGRLENHRLEQALRQLIQRHESFRTSFHIVKGEPVQRIHEQVEFEIQGYDIGNGFEAEGNQEELSPAVILKDFIRPFELAKAPLLRVGLIKLDEEKHILVTDLHHIIYDGTSLAIFFKEFMVLYGEKGSQLPLLGLQYKEYAESQGSRWAREARLQQEKYWLDIFSGEIPVLNLPLDFPRPPVQSYEGHRKRVVLEEAAATALKDIAKENKATLYMVLLAAINVLLMKLGGQSDIIVGTVLAGRKYTEMQHVIGMFVNTIALRNFPAPGKTFGEFLGELRDRTISTFENQDYPFEELVEKARVRRDASRNPIFDVMFRMDNYEAPRGVVEEIEIQGLKLSRYIVESGTSIFDLNFGSRETGNEIVIDLEYCQKLFKEETIARYAGYLLQILKSAKEHLYKQLAEIEILTPEEKKQLLIDFNDTSTGYPFEKSIYGLFAGQEAQTPDYVALMGQPIDTRYQSRRNSLKRNTNITYSRLKEAAGQLAGHLKGKGVKPGTIVGIMVERSLEMVVGLLGILKAGAVYIPLDPEYPEKRIEYILEHSNAAILLTTRTIAGESKKGSDTGRKDRVMFLDEVCNSPGTPGIETVSGERSNNPLAYVIYTSGSTGTPKGVMVNQRNAVNFISGMKSIISFEPGKCILALTTLSFDIFFLETLLPLACGMKVVIATENHQKDPAMLEDLITGTRVEMIQLTPSRLQLLLGFRGDLRAISGVTELMVGGEALPPHLLAEVQAQFHGKIYNMYGPTETTVWSAVKDLTRTSPHQLTIGKPIVNTQIYIVDENMGIQPVGVAGELLIGGDGVAVGYLNNIELTAEKFLSHPIHPNRSHKSLLSYFSNKLYRTGDLARWQPQGEIEFLGRLDHQVKIRGYRVELEEIEEQLLKHDQVKEAVVVMRNNPSGEQSLCAYVVPVLASPANSPETTAQTMIPEIRDQLSERLPYYMIPSYVILLEKMPLTPNGKIDRKVLPEPGSSRSGLGAGVTFIQPATDNEKALARIWKEILKVEEVGIHDNFFDLGGNSLNVIQLNWKLKETFGLDIPVSLMFRNLSIGLLDTYLRQEDERVAAIEPAREIKKIEALNRAKNMYKNTISKIKGG